MCKLVEKMLRPAVDRLPNGLYRCLRQTYLLVATIYCRHKYLKMGKHAFVGRGFRLSVWSRHCVHLGEKTHLAEGNMWTSNYGQITVGRECHFGLNNVIMGPVSMGDGSGTGPNVTVIGPRHAITGSANPEGKMTVIGRNVWISANCTIMFGVQIGDNAIVGPASLVINDIPANTYVLGNPARDFTKMVKFNQAITSRRSDSGGI
jgi:acetyltransferase-like isoleucine patch superfamily enzyme